MDFWDYFIQEGWYIRFRKKEYAEYIGKPPSIYDEMGLDYVYAYVDRTEPIPQYPYTWEELAPGEYTEVIDITEAVPLKTTNRKLLYQYLRGCRTMCRQYTESPFGTKAMTYEKEPWRLPGVANTGYLDESISPFDYPSPLSQIFIVKGVRYGMACYNPTPVPLTPQTNFIGKKMLYTVIDDPELIEKLRKRLIPSKPVEFEIAIIVTGQG